MLWRNGRILTLKHRETYGWVVCTVATDAQAISIHNADLTFIVLDQFHIKNIAHKVNSIRKWNHILKKNEPVIEELTGKYFALYRNALWSSAAIWRRSTLVQLKASCLTASNHYLNQYWLTINGVLYHSFQGNIYLNIHDINSQIYWSVEM